MAHPDQKHVAEPVQKKQSFSSSCYLMFLKVENLKLKKMMRMRLIKKLMAHAHFHWNVDNDWLWVKMDVWIHLL